MKIIKLIDNDKYEVEQILRGHSDVVYKVIEIKQNELISVSLDKNMKVWKYSQNGFNCITTIVFQNIKSHCDIIKINEKEFVTSIKIDDTVYSIRNNGDFRVILDCFLALNDAELNQQERLFASLIIFYEDLETVNDIFNNANNLEKLVNEMYNFFNCGSTTSLGTKSNHKLVDWEKDAQIICSAINKVAGKEIRFEPYIHWWTFMGYYTAVGESLLATIISIRDKTIRGKKLEKHEREFKRDTPQYFTWDNRSLEEKEADNMIKELWNSGG